MCRWEPNQAAVRQMRVRDAARERRPVLPGVLLAAALGVTAPGDVGAQGVEVGVIRQLEDLGYSEISVSRTWLGRLRFVARRGEWQREIVLNPATGVVMRDFSWGAPDGAPNIEITEPYEPTSPNAPNAPGGPSGVIDPSQAVGAPAEYGPFPDPSQAVGAPGPDDR